MRQDESSSQNPLLIQAARNLAERRNPCVVAFMDYLHDPDFYHVAGRLVHRDELASVTPGRILIQVDYVDSSPDELANMYINSLVGG